MQVPFQKLGPGQSGRWVYQVMGSDGPVPNPTGIRYLSAPPAGLHIPGLSGSGAATSASALLGYAQVVDLGLQALDLGISVATLMAVRKQSAMLRELQVGVTALRALADLLVDTVERIDIGVAELHLRKELQHALRSAQKEDEYDLVVLSDLAGQALRRFERSVGPIEVGFAPRLQLAPDVRDLVHACMSLLWAARRTALEAHNRAVSGDPSVVKRDSSLDGEIRRVAAGAAHVRVTRRTVRVAAEQVRKHLADSWSFFGDSGAFRDRTREELSVSFTGPFKDSSLLSASERLVDALGDGVAKGCSRELLRAAYLRPLQAWAATDACLVYRLLQEIQYQEKPAYWQEIAPWLGDYGPVGVIRELTPLPR